METTDKMSLIVPSPDQPACHRFFVPIPLGVPAPLKPNEIIVTGKVGFIACLKESCHRYDRTLKMCNDNVQTAALYKISSIIDERLDTIVAALVAPDVHATS